MPFLGSRRRAYRPPPILDDGSSPVSRPSRLLWRQAVATAGAAYHQARWRWVLIPPRLEDDGSSAVSHRRPVVLAEAARQTAQAAYRARFRQPTIGLVRLADGTDARTQPRPIVGLEVARATAVARVRSSHRAVWLPPIRREPAVADTSRPFASPLVGFPAAAMAPLVARLRHRQPLIPPFPISDGTDARSQPRPIIGLATAADQVRRAAARFRQPFIPSWPFEPPPQPARLTRGLLVGIGEAHQARLAARARLRQAIRPPQPAVALTSPGVVVTRSRLTQMVMTRSRTIGEIVTRTRTR